MKNKIEQKNKLGKIIDHFNPDENGLTHHGIFGLPFAVEESKMILVPLPWEATVSYGSGTSNGPKSILDASQQIDLYDPIYPSGWREGIAMQDIPSSIFYENQHTREKTLRYLDKYAEGEIDLELQSEINNECLDFKNHVKEITEGLLNDDKIVGIVGGDHSVPLGYLEALSEVYESFGVLHIDAHADLRDAYEGLTYSHASIFFNALKIKNISKLVQVGIRDLCEQEHKLIENSDNRVVSYPDYDIKKAIFEGKSLKEKYTEIIANLPKNVYISFDIDGLIPYLSPNTGTPVLGGFTIEELVYLVEEILATGRKIIGFDLSEVAPSTDIKNQWDGNVGARVLYKLCLLSLKSQK